ncbi:MAG: hypothetical protein A0129_10615 [Limnobacter sp. CACIAM 66H1]|uniref:carbon-nitrogen hydrolase family protein n=1 Tax=Limnobacter sp. CACIAM 66H1 TaxID=1813033 RepID=UPI0007A8140A|nr:carbon-nitrogen hydrolase family protein [Limnobacter sp. CACIAM 66H1]KYP10870.1 MAG: hypothetical protein A0129_10615 [Limnobacter sp. CACIAM 66H1]
MALLTQVAAIQLELTIGRPQSNIDKCLSKLEQAFRQGNQFVALPEFASTPICLNAEVQEGILFPHNAFVDGLLSLCCQYGAAAGGSYLEQRGSRVYNTYAFVDQAGQLFKHDKDIPTMVESAFYQGGSSDRLLNTANGPIGVAMCWEMIRTATVHQLRNRVDLIMAGTHWWTEPGWRFPATLLRKAHRRNLALLTQAPSTLSRLTGAPVVHASQIGQLKGRFAVTPGFSLPMSTQLLGQSQIVNNRGEVLAALSAEDGEGIISAHIEMSNAGASLQPTGHFWNAPMPWETRLLWAQQNAACAPMYVNRHSGQSGLGH